MTQPRDDPFAAVERLAAGQAAAERAAKALAAARARLILGTQIAAGRRGLGGNRLLHYVQRVGSFDLNGFEVSGSVPYPGLDADCARL